GLRARSAGIGPCFRFCQRPASDPLAAGELWNVALVLLAVARDKNMTRAKRNMRGGAQGDRRIDTGNLFHDDRVVDITVSGAAERFGKYGAEHAQAAKFAKNIEREMLRLIPLHHVRTHLRFGEIADRLAELILFWGKSEIQTKRSPL